MSWRATMGDPLTYETVGRLKKRWFRPQQWHSTIDIILLQSLTNILLINPVLGELSTEPVAATEFCSN
jgi:hypothetical protein